MFCPYCLYDKIRDLFEWIARKRCDVVEFTKCEYCGAYYWREVK